MIYRLDTPSLPRAISGLRVVQWHCAEGDFVPFGARLLELRADATLRRVQPTNDSAGNERRSSRRRSRDDKTGDLLAHDPPRFRVEILASEPAHLRRITVTEGGPVNDGDQLALLSTEPDESIDAGNAVSFRVVADVIRLDADLLAEDL